MSTDHINQELFGKAHALLLSAGRELAVWLSKCLPELDSDLTELYGIPVKVLNQAVKRNARRFPDDFMFQLRQQEFTNLQSQSVTSSRDLQALKTEWKRLRNFIKYVERKKWGRDV